MTALDNLTINVTAAAKICAVVLAVASAAYSFYHRRIKRAKLSQATEADKLIAQYAQQFAGNPDAYRFFEDVQLQRALERILGFLPMPSEFPAVFRFHQNEQASLRDLKHAWQHRRPCSDATVSFALTASDRVSLWVSKLHGVGCILGGASIFGLIFVPPFHGPLPALEQWALGLAVMSCAMLPLFAGESALAVKRIEHRRGLQAKLLPPSEDSQAGTNTP